MKTSLYRDNAETSHQPAAVHSQHTRRYISGLIRYLLVVAILLTTLPTLPLHAANVQQETPPTPDADQRQAQIVGGEEAEEGAWPWMVAILLAQFSDPYMAQFCGGSLIDPQWVLTAAHCVVENGEVLDPTEIDILVGTTQLSHGSGERIDVEKIIVHEEYSEYGTDFDIALLQLATPSTQPTVGLPDETMLALEEPDTMATVIGWGSTVARASTRSLLQVDVPLVAQETCSQAYGVWNYTISDNMICAGYAEGGQDACSGDSGGPLVVPNTHRTDKDSPEWIEVGIVSWGKGCAREGAYGVYARTSAFVHWIETQQAQNPIVPKSDPTPDIGGQSQETPTIYLPIIQR